MDLQVDPETGRVTVLRYTVAQDAGRALQAAYVEGQFQGGAIQGIGCALNEEYVYGPDGRLQNAGFLDYRMPVASDVPMIDAILVFMISLFHTLALLAITSVVSTFFFLVTGKIYLGALVALLVAWMFACSQVIAPIPV